MIYIAVHPHATSASILYRKKRMKSLKVINVRIRDVKIFHDNANFKIETWLANITFTITSFSNMHIVLSHDDCDGLSPLAILSNHPNEGISTKFSSHYVMIDTNIVLQEIDLLEDVNGLQNVIILQTVLKEVRHRSTAIYKRLKDIISHNKRRFYVFLNEHHKGNCIF